VLGLSAQARVLEPAELVDEARERTELLVERHAEPFELAAPKRRRSRAAEPAADDGDGKPESPIRPERFARLITLAGILIEAARDARHLKLGELCETLQVSEQELRQDIDVLNVVNFGGGSYVLYAEVKDGTIEVDPEPYGDNFARPARLLPLEAKALVAAIDLIGEHLPEGSLSSARAKIVKALGQDPAEEGLQITTAKGDDSEVARVVSKAIAGRRLLAIDYYKENEDEFTERRVEPYKLMNGQEGWYVHAFDLEKDAPRSYRLDRIREATVLDEEFEPREGVEPDVHGWPATGEVPASRTARIWVSPDRARWAREDRRVVQELADGAVIVERAFAGGDWLAREVLKEAGDAVVLEPEDARRAVLEAAEAVLGVVKS
jgi:proteasome accessory factor BC